MTRAVALSSLVALAAFAAEKEAPAKPRVAVLYFDINSTDPDNTAAQLKHNFFTGPWLNEALLSYTKFTRGSSPASPGLPHRLFIYPSGDCCFEIGSARSIQDFTQRGPNFRDDLTYTGFQLAGEHVIKGGLSLNFPTYNVNKDNNGTPSFEYQDIRDQGFGNQVYNYLPN